jgi:hypothetical protein
MGEANLRAADRWCGRLLETRSTPADDLAVAQIHKQKHQQGEK